jgi:hypothetical protein
MVPKGNVNSMLVRQPLNLAISSASFCTNAAPSRKVPRVGLLDPLGGFIYGQEFQDGDRRGSNPRPSLELQIDGQYTRGGQGEAPVGTGMA